MPAFKDLTGKRFGRLTALARVANRNAQSYWLCRCRCGREVDVRGISLTSGNTRSCGCLLSDLKRAQFRKMNRAHPAPGSRRTHGHFGTPTYDTWSAMIQRCTNPKSAKYPRYGGRGIKVCARWRSFENFLADMGERPKNRTIHRLNNDGNYEPGNAEWATKKTQAGARSDNRRLKFRGKWRTLSQWSRATGIPHNTIANRLDRLGWSLEEALTLPASPIERKLRRRTPD